MGHDILYKHQVQFWTWWYFLFHSFQTNKLQIFIISQANFYNKFRPTRIRIRVNIYSPDKSWLAKWSKVKRLIILELIASEIWNFRAVQRNEIFETTGKLEINDLVETLGPK